MTYSQKLKDPRWQKKRLEILQRDNWTCRCCNDKKSTLSVHHISYSWGKNPWEYDENNFIVLCESCHKLWHKIDTLDKFEFHDLVITFITDEKDVSEYLQTKISIDPIKLSKKLEEIILKWNKALTEKRILITENLLPLGKFIKP